MRTTYADGSGNEHEAVHLTWDQVAEILGEPHDGRPEQDERLVTHLLEEGAPAWVERAEGWVDEKGWGLIGPALDRKAEVFRGDDSAACFVAGVREALREIAEGGAP